MNFDQNTLYNLLPAIYRIRDAEQGYPLKALLGVMAEQIAVLEEDLAQLYDDQFIETCAEWVVPYLGDLLGYRPLHQPEGEQLPANRRLPSQRAQVANTIGYRRRKGTAAVLEQLAWDVTGWEANVVEFFRRLVTAQHLDHQRPESRTPSLRNGGTVARAGTPFSPLAHSADVRRVDSRHRRGKYNIPHVGIFLWRLQAYAVHCSPAREFDSRRYRFHPLGYDVPLYGEPEPEESLTDMAAGRHVARQLSRRLLAENLDHYYGAGCSVALYREGEKEPISSEDIAVVNLTRWKDVARLPADKYGIDPVLGRFTRPPRTESSIRVSFHYGFSGDLGGGSYDRSQALFHAPGVEQVPQEHAGLEEALAALPHQKEDGQPEVRGQIRIDDSSRYEIGKTTLKPGQTIIVQAGNGCRPLIALNGEWLVEGAEDSELVLSGLLLSGGVLRVEGSLRRLRLSHCTLVPGLGLEWDGRPTDSGEPSLVVTSAGTDVELDHCIVGAMRIHEGASATLKNTIVDATAPDGTAYAEPSGATAAGGRVRFEKCTVSGRVYTRLLELASNSIFLAPLHASQRQAGCVRYSYLPPDSKTPRRHHCYPENETQAERIKPHFTSLRYGEPGYCQLRPNSPPEIWQGADDEAEMGAFHDLYQPQREANLRIRLDEYLRFGLEAGIFYAS